jgi:signal transduction histidine kinase
MTQSRVLLALSAAWLVSPMTAALLGASGRWVVLVFVIGAVVVFGFMGLVSLVEKMPEDRALDEAERLMGRAQDLREQYLASADEAERVRLAVEIQRTVAEVRLLLEEADL